MCNVVAANLGRSEACFDEKLFLLVVHAGLSREQQVMAAKAAFARAGQPQGAPDPICICGIPAAIPARAPLPRPSRRAARRAILAAAWMGACLGVHALLRYIWA